ncbi:MAG: hypothetical protein Q4A62_05945 [Eikenella sp.]|nr:hypothetical protein [Eikenella sp.]
MPYAALVCGATYGADKILPRQTKLYPELTKTHFQATWTLTVHKHNMPEKQINRIFKPEKTDK